MFSVWRTERIVNGEEGVEPILSFSERLTAWWICIEVGLEELGWPPPRGRVFVQDDAWAPVPKEWEECWNVDVPANVEAPERNIETGMNFTLRRAVPLSKEYWLVSIAKQIEKIRNASDPDLQLSHSFDLGVLIEKSKLHSLRAAAVRKKKQQERNFGSAQRKPNDDRKQKAEEWRSVARNVALAHPRLRGSSLRRVIHRELRKLGSDAEPSDRSIRRALAVQQGE